MNIHFSGIIRFFVIMVWISIEPRNIGGWPSYFADDPVIHLGCLYSVQIRGYDAWSKYFTTLIRFKHIRSDFHPEAGTYLCGEKYHRLCYFIRISNYKSKIIFVLGEHGGFDEGGISMSIRYCPVQMDNKYKTDKYRVGFSSWMMPSIISSIILMCTKVIKQQTLISTHHYTTYPPHRNMFLML